MPEVGEGAAGAGAQGEGLLEVGEESLKAGAIADGGHACVVVNGATRPRVFGRHRQPSLSVTALSCSWLTLCRSLVDVVSKPCKADHHFVGIVTIGIDNAELADPTFIETC